MLAEFPKISVKMMISKHFASPEQRVVWIKLFSFPPDKSSLRIWNKYFLTEVYRNIQRFDFQVLQECSSWASINGAVLMLFQTPTKNMFLDVLQEYIFYNVEWVEVRKMSEVFWAKGVLLFIFWSKFHFWGLF